MKPNVKMSRTINQLEKMFRMLNEDFFGSKLEMPVITVTPTPRAYGHYSTYNAWVAGNEGKREINIASGTLDRPLENITATLVHEMCHMYNDTVINVQDCSRGGTYHNKFFKQTAESHGLVVSRSDKYGWSHTEPNDELIEWLCDHDEFNEIEMNRADVFTNIGINGKGTTGTRTRTTNGHHRRYICPCCRTIIRATKEVHIMCVECVELMIEQ